MNETLSKNPEHTGAQSSEWNELTELGSVNFAAGKHLDNLTLAETSDQHLEKVAAAAAKVKAAYKNPEDVSPLNSSDAEQSNQSQAQPQPTTFAAQYDLGERDRVDRVKSELDFLNIDRYERQAIATEPSDFRKTLRLFADKLGIRTKRSEQRREREAMHVALTEYRAERAAREQVWQEAEKRRTMEQARRQAELEAEQKRREQEALARDMIDARKVIAFNQHERLEGQRAQEIIEQDLNSRLLTVDSLETAILAEDPEIQKRSIVFEDATIPVYDLRGMPFSLLSTTIDYRKANKPGDIGTETYKTVMDNPAVWAERRDQAEQSAGFSTRNSNARGDTISASYYNSEHNINSRVPGDLIYGFEKVDADSIISISNGDGATSNMAGKAETKLSKHMLDIIPSLEGANGAGGYNEILLRRYSENGVAKRPDYIITEDGKITEAALKHAKFFNIPIVNIERSVYAEKARRRGEKLINSISEQDSYLEIDQKFATLGSMAEYKYALPRLEGIGRNYDIPRLPYKANATEKKRLEISQMEQLKRLDFIAKVIKDTTEHIKAGETTSPESGLPSQLEYFDVSLSDVHNHLFCTKHSDHRDDFRSAPGNCNEISIDFRIKGSSRIVKTRVYDGERIFEADEALARGNISKEDIENADSSFYNALEPIVREYFEACRQESTLT